MKTPPPAANQGWKTKRGYAISLACFLVLLVVVVLMYSLNNNGQVVLMVPTMSQIDESPTCKFPLLDPWDKSIQSYISHPRTFDCKHVQLDDLVYMDYFGYLQLNDTAVELAEISLRKNISCSFALVDRSSGKGDSSNSKSDWKVLTANRSFAATTDLAEVKCISGNKNDIVYYDLFPHPSNLSKTSFLPTTDEQLSVLFWTMDSTSLSMFRRNLPKTFEYLANQMHAFVFKGYTKMGDNTFPNMIAALTGKRVYNHQADMGAEFTEDFSAIQYDHWDLIWKRYAKKGYVTSYNEDKPEWGLFHYLAKGFANKPTHHSYRPFWLQMKWADLIDQSTRFCFGNKPKTTYQVDIVRRLLMKYRSTRQFIYTFFTELSHDYANELERADETFVAFFTEMHQQGYFNNTIVIVMGDHGHRFSSIRRTLVGLVEERMPAFTITFPPWFYERYPNIKENLQRNQMRLSSPFDLHETFIDILNANYEGQQRTNHSRGLSQLYPLPANRTCTEAGVPDYFCVCQQAEPIDANDPVVTKAAVAMVDHINSLLKEFKDKCVTLTYNTTLHAEVFGISKVVAEGVKSGDEAKTFQGKGHNSEIKAIRVGIEVKPSNAQFEGVVQYNKASGVYRVVDSVSRINKYGEQSDCMEVPEMRKYCYCKDYKPSSDV